MFNITHCDSNVQFQKHSMFIGVLREFQYEWSVQLPQIIYIHT